jgi:glycosyltransferase involved in cell wall biosynthesis
VDTAAFTFVDRVPEAAPLVFLGRLDPCKGVHHAIEIAQRAGHDLVIAGTKVDTVEGAAYFDRAVSPHLDGRIRYVGPVDDRAKNSLLGSAAALLMPIEWEEPFGIVMAEALACGTPVIGFARGAVPEVIDSGRTGFVVRNVHEAVEAIGRLSTLDRTDARRACERRFDASVMCQAYERLYGEMAALPTSGY